MIPENEKMFQFSKQYQWDFLLFLSLVNVMIEAILKLVYP